MGTGQPKPDEAAGGDGLTDVQRELIELEEYIKDAIITRSGDDRMLAIVLDIVLSSIADGRPLYPNIFDEPIFYRRYIKPWIEEGLREAAKIAEVTKQEPPR